MSETLTLASSGGQALTALDPESPLAIAGLTVAYHRKPVLWDVTWSAPDGGLVAIVGPNGAGKSTFIKAALGLIPRVSGESLIYGRPVEDMRSRTGYVPQRNAVDWEFPASALDVVTMGLYRQVGWFCWPGKRHREMAFDCLERVDMADFADRQIGQLSGGQQQRVFLARALAQEADIYVMDEPFAGCRCRDRAGHRGGAAHPVGSRQDGDLRTPRS